MEEIKIKEIADKFFEEQEKLNISYDSREAFIEGYKLAKKMEKEQHQETWDSAHQAGRFEGKGIAEENWQTFESYWEENFKSE